MNPLLTTYKALADESRLRILRVLVRGRYNVNELVDILGMGQSRVSRHLKLLLDAGLATVQRHGTWAYYEGALSGEPVSEAQLEVIRQHGDSLPQADGDERRRQECLELRRQKSRSFHDAIASDWATLRLEMIDAGLTDLILSRMGHEAQVVVDLGCGAGELLLPLVQRASRVIGVDGSAAMLEEARKMLDRSDSPFPGVGERVELRLGALEHLPMADREVDAAVLNMVLHHLADPPVVLAEVYRALAPGGEILVCDLLRHEQERFRVEFGDLWLGFTRLDIEQMLEGAGFSAISLEEITSGSQATTIVLARAHKEG